MCGNYNRVYSELSSKTLWIFNPDSNSSSGFLDEGKKEWVHITCIYFNQISALIFIITEYILIELVHIYMVSQNLKFKFTYFHTFISLLNIDINRCQGRVKFQSSPSTQNCFNYLTFSLKSRFSFLFKCTVDNL